MCRAFFFELGKKCLLELKKTFFYSIDVEFSYLSNGGNLGGWKSTCPPGRRQTWPEPCQMSICHTFPERSSYSVFSPPSAETILQTIAFTSQLGLNHEHGELIFWNQNILLNTKLITNCGWKALEYGICILKIPLTRIAFTSQQGLNHDMVNNFWNQAKPA